MDAQRVLASLTARTNQPEALADIHYYLGKPGLLNRTPVLLLLRSEETMFARPEDPADGVAGAVLLFQYKVAGLSLGMYTSNDRSGRRTVLARPEHRAEVATQAAEYLLERGANLVMLSLRAPDISGAICEALTRKTAGRSWIFRQREVPDYLPLRSTYDETLAQIGKRTRTHMRYYRRRAEEQLSCRFYPQLEVGREELLRLNRACLYPVPNAVAEWRLNALKQFDQPILMGLRDASGRLLGVLGGRRFNGDADVLWQMNRNLQNHSLSLAMRTYLIEHEVGRDTQRIYLDGGSAHSLCNSFARGVVTDCAAMRHTALSFVVRRIARWVIPGDNQLAHLLVGEKREPVSEPVLGTE